MGPGLLDIYGSVIAAGIFGILAAPFIIRLAAPRRLLTRKDQLPRYVP
jgi:hypothetical protein